MRDALPQKEKTKTENACFAEHLATVSGSVEETAQKNAFALSQCARGSRRYPKFTLYAGRFAVVKLPRAYVERLEIHDMPSV
jgi:hypothetical protein